MDETLPPPTDIKKARQRKKEKENSDRPPKAAELYLAVSDAINRSPASILPEFPEHYGVVEIETGARVPVLISDDESMMMVPDDAVVSSIIRYCDRLGATHGYVFTHAQAKECMRSWLVRSPAIPKPAYVRWPGEAGACWRRLPWPQKSGATPTWDDLLERMSNHEAFRMWIGSLFFEQSYIQQYVWMRGDGGDGKGAISRFLHKIFGASFRSKHPPSAVHGDKFWSYSLINARVVVFPDCNSRGFVTGGLFKALTGGDPIEVEQKGRMSFTTTINCKFLFMSNEEPSLSSEKSDQRRVIYCSFASRDVGAVDPTFESRLWQEGGAFITDCVTRYLQAYPNHGAIVADQTEASELAESNEDWAAAIFERKFIINRTARHLWLSGPRVAEILRDAKLDKTEIKNFVAWLLREHKTKLGQVRIGADNVRRYDGLCERIDANAATATLRSSEWGD